MAAKSANANATASRAVLHAFLVALGDLHRYRSALLQSECAELPPEPPFSFTSASLPSAEKQRRREAWEQQRRRVEELAVARRQQADAAERYYWQALKLESAGKVWNQLAVCALSELNEASPSTSSTTSSGTTSSGNNGKNGKNGNGNDGKKRGTSRKGADEEAAAATAAAATALSSSGVLCVAAYRYWRALSSALAPFPARENLLQVCARLRQAERSAPAASALHGRTTAAEHLARFRLRKS